MKKMIIKFTGLIFILLCCMSPGLSVSAEGIDKTDIYNSKSGFDYMMNDYIPVKAIPVNDAFNSGLRSVSYSNLKKVASSFMGTSESDQYKSWGRSNLKNTYDDIDKIALYDYFFTCFSDTTDLTASQIDYYGTTYYIMFQLNIENLTLTIDDVAAVYGIFKLDHPEFYWLDFTILYAEGGINTPKVIILTDSDYDTPSERSICDTLIYSKAQEYQNAVAGLSTTYDIAKKVHDKIISEIDYVFDSYGQPSIELYAHNIVGVLDGEGSVCEGYAKAYQYILNYLGIPNIIVTGEVTGQGHAWNTVQLENGYFYYVDTTWDDQPSAPNGIIYDFFMKGKTLFEQNSDVRQIHTPYSPSGIGFEYLYPLPNIPTSDFDPNSIISIINLNCSLAYTQTIYDGTEKKPTLAIAGLIEGTDYTVYYIDNINVGTATVVAKGLGNYYGSIINTFDITQQSISTMSATLSASSFIYNGKSKKPIVNLIGLANEIDYVVAYNNNVLPGSANVTVNGIGNYFGTITKTFTIKLGIPTSSVIAGSRQVKVKWATVTGASGYEIKMSTSKSGKYSVIKTEGSTKSSTIKTGLAKGKKYYFKVRAYKTVNGKKVYSDYSTIVSTTVK